MKSICVYCGSNAGSDPAFTDAAIAVGQRLAQRDVTLVYGGGRVGLMGQVADAAMNAGGEVVGVIPEFMAIKEVAHFELTKLHIVETTRAAR